jgi:ferritin-like metal-binding protein YciE
VARLEKIFKALGETAGGKKCKGMAGLIEEAAEMIAEDPDPEELDAGLISAAQRVEHYEIAGYGCVSAYAKLLGEDWALSLLKQTLEEEKETDKKLTQLSGRINLEDADTEKSDEDRSENKKIEAKDRRPSSIPRHDPEFQRRKLNEGKLKKVTPLAFALGS